MSSKHPRYYEVAIELCHEDCPEGGGVLKIVLFERDEYLRSHAVKHLANIFEMEKAWLDILPIGQQEIMHCFDALRDLGCPFCEQGHRDSSTPPCLDHGQRCRLFNDCTECVTDLERAYLDVIKKVLEEGGRIPRYACFRDKQSASFFWVLPDRQIIAKAVLRKDAYNLMTLHSPAFNMSWPEMCNYEKEKIHAEAYGGGITWCRDENWATDSSPMSGRQDRKKKPQKGRVRDLKAPYVRHTSQGWRRFLEDIN